MKWNSKEIQGNSTAREKHEVERLDFILSKERHKRDLL